MSALDDLVAEMEFFAFTAPIREDDRERMRALLSAAIREEIRDELGIDEASGP